MDEQSLVKYMLGANRVKYNVLNNCFQSANIHPERYRMMVMHVDAHCIFRRLFRARRLASIYVNNREEMVRDLVVGFYNVLGHYRRYMAVHLHMDNDIYVVFNRRAPSYHAALIPEFGKKLYGRYATVDPDYGFTVQAIETAWEFILGISPYFEGIYCIDNQGIEDFALMCRMGFRDDILYCILSRNVYATQLLRENVVQLYPKRDDSWMITEKTCCKNGMLRKSTQKDIEGITPSMLPLLWTLCGCGDMSVPHTRFAGVAAAAARVAQRMLEDGILVPGMSIQSFLDEVPPYLRAGSTVEFKASKAELQRRFQALSAPIAANAITNDQMARVMAFLYDVFDANALEQLNDLLVRGSLDPQLLELENLNLANGVIYE